MTEIVTRRFDRKRQLAFAIPAAIIAYLVYAAISFDLAGLAQRARFDNAAILLSDFWSHKTHVTRDNRSGALRVAIEGESKGTYPEDLRVFEADVASAKFSMKFACFSEILAPPTV